MSNRTNVDSKKCLFLISGASGTGKTSLVGNILKSDPNIDLSISFTTRKQRGQEVNDRDYHFVSEEQFDMMVKESEFIEWAEVHGNLYGTSRKWLENTIREKDVILEIDHQGASQIREKISESVSIFILPPCWRTLKERLANRATDSNDSIDLRLVNAKKEMFWALSSDYVIINDDFDRAIEELRAIIMSARLTSRQRRRDILEMLKDLP
ncbi:MULTISPECIES: guanylate kinase [Candidatus Ichthyocystis]|uniref:guanylate kinase n=1 Tax=Candidatus Ichthyocystis TaxID=2929841 RepID=UPI000B2FA79A|nr:MULTISPECIES: guanylate kinase [Ichthyocystis]